jgi:hypothetical protein
MYSIFYGDEWESIRKSGLPPEAHGIKRHLPLLIPSDCSDHEEVGVLPVLCGTPSRSVTKVSEVVALVQSPIWQTADGERDLAKAKNMWEDGEPFGCHHASAFISPFSALKMQGGESIVECKPCTGVQSARTRTPPRTKRFPTLSVLLSRCCTVGCTR